ncbi:MAG TPA: ABC-type transport auxiliary lipoprotein family protein [Gammaproteobacteria bacterium]|nr:ABC-type transport auxiliary lipoprotein family protein [Gammaproteobacteria bacterium]
MTRHRLIFPLLVSLTGCGAPGVVPQDSYYRMGDPESVAPAGAMLEGTVVVPRFLADGLVSERRLIYVEENSPQVLRQYNFHFWSESPTRMIQERTVEYLRRARIAATVVTPEFRAAADYQLTGKIRRLEQIRGSQPGIVVSLEFGLYRVRDNRLLHLQNYVQEMETDGNDVGRATAAMSAAVIAILSRLTEDLSRL